jgi:prepilin peptidase CpaA
MTLSTVAVIVFPLLLAYAASSDLFTMRIANWLVATLTLSFFVIAFAVGLPWDQLVAHTGAAAAVLLVGFAFFAFGWIGAGDAKLAAATTLWLGLGLMLPYLVYAALLGGSLTLGLLAVRRWPLPPPFATWDWVARLHDRKTGVPYGIALAAAGILVYSRTDIFLQLTA